MESKKFLTAAEVAAEFGLDEATLQQFVDSHDVRALPDRGTWKYHRDELQALVDSGQIAPPSADLWLDEGTSSADQILTVGAEADDDLSYIELDEEALAEHATMISKSRPFEDRTPAVEDAVTEDWFVPSNVDEMKSPSTPQQSSSDVRVYTGEEPQDASAVGSPPSSDSDVRPAPASGSDSIFDLDLPATKRDSDSDVRLAGAGDLTGALSHPVASNSADSDSDVRIAKGEIDSDSDVQIADDVPGGMLEGSGIVLDFDLGAGSTVSSSGSSLRLPQSGAGHETSAWEEVKPEDVDVTGDSDLSLAAAEAGDSGIRLSDDDSGSGLHGMANSGLALDGDSRVGTPSTGSSVLYRAETGAGDLKDDSGLSLEDGDDSGLSLESLSADSGLSLEAADSGLSLEAAGDSGISLTSAHKTLADGDLAATMFDEMGAGQTQTLDLANESDDDFDMNLSDSGATAEIHIGDDDDDFAETTATVVRKGRGKNGPGLTEAFQLDDAPEVEDLDIADDLDAVVSADDNDEEVAVLEDEEVFDTSDETFEEEIAATDDDDEEYLAAAAATKKNVGPREPSWGTGMSIGLIACSLLLAANALILWSGISTMWTGAEASGPASALIAQLAGLF